MMTIIRPLPLPSRRHRGFTLLELMAALAIVILLASLSWSSYQHYVNRARRAEGRAAVLQVLLQQERHFAYQHRYQAFQPGPGESGFKWYSGGTPATSAYALSAQACAGEDLASCVQVSATPGDAHVDAAYRDTQCGVLRADSRGTRSADGNDCW